MEDEEDWSLTLHSLRLKASADVHLGVKNLYVGFEKQSSAEQLFDLIDDGDGQISIEEFLQGAKRLRGAAKSIDMAQMLVQVNKLGSQLAKIESCIGRASARASDRPFPSDRLVWI